jgi:cytoskeletal protein CcmA (bactofilin family)
VTWNIFNRDDPADAEWYGLVERGVSFEGTLRVPGTFRIDGELKGSIISAGRLILAENAVVEGEVRALQVDIAGTVTGKIHAEEVSISASGRVHGEIHSRCLHIEAGGILDGVCHVPSPGGEDASLPVPVRPAACG